MLQIKTKGLHDFTWSPSFNSPVHSGICPKRVERKAETDKISSSICANSLPLPNNWLRAEALWEGEAAWADPYLF